MELNSQYIGNLIKSMRKRASLTQSELAERLGVGNKTVSKWEQGRGIPDISLLYRLSLELDVDIESILAGNLEDLGKEWTGVIYMGETIANFILGRQELEYMLSLFLLVGIRDIVVISSAKRMQEDEKTLREYYKKGFLNKICCIDASEKFIQRIENKNVCFLFQHAFLYGMNLTRYMRRAMLGGNATILAIRQGKSSFMPEIHFHNNYLCISSGEKKLAGTGWYMFPMIFGSRESIINYFENMRKLKSDIADIDSLFEFFEKIYVVSMERGMLAFSIKTEKERKLAEQVISGIERSQHIQIGNPEQIMAVRGWK